MRLIGFIIYRTLPFIFYLSSTPFPSQHRSCVLCTKQSRGYPYSFLCSLLTGFPRGCRVNIATSYNYVCMKSCLVTLSHVTNENTLSLLHHNVSELPFSLYSIAYFIGNILQSYDFISSLRYLLLGLRLPPIFGIFRI